MVENEAFVKSNIIFRRYLNVPNILKYNKALKYVIAKVICFTPLNQFP